MDRPYTTFEEARHAADDLARAAGYALAIHHRKGPNKVVLRCNKGRPAVSHATAHESKRRKTASRRTDCPYKLIIRRDAANTWIIREVGEPYYAHHNHDLVDPASFSRYRAAAIEARRERIVSEWKSGVAPQKIHTGLLEDPDLEVRKLSRDDVYNVLRRHRKEELKDQTPIQ